MKGIVQRAIILDDHVLFEVAVKRPRATDPATTDATIVGFWRGVETLSEVDCPVELSVNGSDERP